MFKNQKGISLIFLVLIIAFIIVAGIVAVVFVINKDIHNGQEILSNSETQDNVNNSETTDNKKMITALEYFDTTKFDKSKFSGLLYDRDGNAYNVLDFINNNGYNYDYNDQINVIVDYMSYSFTKDYSLEKSAWQSSSKSASDEYIYKILEILGHPSTYYEYYEREDEDSMAQRLYRTLLPSLQLWRLSNNFPWS